MLSDEALVKWKFENTYSFTHRQKVRKNFRLQKGVDTSVEVSLEPSFGKTPFSSGLCLSFSSHHSSLAHPTQHMHGRMTHCCSHDMSPGHHGEALPLLPASALRSTPPFEIRPLAVGFICLRLVVSVTNFAYILANFLMKELFYINSFVKGTHHGTGVEVGWQLGRISIFPPWQSKGLKPSYQAHGKHFYLLSQPLKNLFLKCFTIHCKTRSYRNIK